MQAILDTVYDKIKYVVDEDEHAMDAQSPANATFNLFMEALQHAANNKLTIVPLENSCDIYVQSGPKKLANLSEQAAFDEIKTGLAGAAGAADASNVFGAGPLSVASTIRTAGVKVKVANSLLNWNNQGHLATISSATPATSISAFFDPKDNRYVKYLVFSASDANGIGNFLSSTDLTLAILAGALLTTDVVVTDFMTMRHLPAMEGKEYEVKD